MPRPRLVAALTAPRATFETLARDPEGWRTGAGAAAILGLAWAGLSLALALGGHAPSVTLIPLPRARYYLWQALFATPLWLALWAVAAATTHRVARAFGGRADAAPGTAAVMGHALASPLIALFLLPDVVVLATSGFDALGPAMRYYAPLGPLAAWALATLGVRHAQGLSTGRAVLAAFAGLLAQALLGAPLLR